MGRPISSPKSTPATFHRRAAVFIVGRITPELYEHEKPATVPAGLGAHLWIRAVHRGSAMLATEGVRFSQFVAFHTAGYPWLGSHTFQGLGDRPEMRRLLVRATPRQRELLGFPPRRQRLLDRGERWPTVWRHVSGDGRQPV